jgi:prophage antirepressor-like protein
MKNTENQNTHLALFKGKNIRRTVYQKEWWFSILDVIKILTDSPQPKTYWAKMKERDTEMSQPFPFWEQLKMLAEDGKMRETDCANTEGLFRIIQSIPSPKAEPFKRWLAKVGYERMQEIENPELATKRTRMLYNFQLYNFITTL